MNHITRKNYLELFSILRFFPKEQLNSSEGENTDLKGDLKKLFQQLNKAYEIQQVSSSQRQAVIKLIE